MCEIVLKKPTIVLNLAYQPVIANYDNSMQITAFSPSSILSFFSWKSQIPIIERTSGRDGANNIFRRIISIAV